MRLLAALAVVAGCATSQPVVQVEDGVPFVLALGAEADLDGHRIRFVEVVEDSRCPEGATCVRAGLARIAVSVDGETVTLVAPGGEGVPEPRRAGRFEVEALALRPAPTLEPTGATPEATLVVALAD